jgi:hypothetical protein
VEAATDMVHRSGHRVAHRLSCFELGGEASPVTPYGVFLDQLDAGNVASVTFEGNEIRGRFRSPIGGTTDNGVAQKDVFRSRVPDFGDPALIGELRKQRVAIDVGTPSPWTWLLGRVPWPMLAFLAVMLVAALARMLREGLSCLAPAAPACPRMAWDRSGSSPACSQRNVPCQGQGRKRAISRRVVRLLTLSGWG